MLTDFVPSRGYNSSKARMQSWVAAGSRRCVRGGSLLRREEVYGASVRGGCCRGEHRRIPV